MKIESRFISFRPGQAALIVTLVVLIGLTIGVAVLSRSVTTTSISTQEEQRARSFSAAEAGIEDALRRDLGAYLAAGQTGENFSVGGSTVDYIVTQLTNITAQVDPGQVVSIDWSQSSATQFGISWNASGCSPQLIVTEIDSSGDITHRSFSSSDSPQTLSEALGGITRMRFVGCSTNVTLNAPLGASLSFYQVDSTGTSGETSSQVQVIKSEPAGINLLDFAVFSGGNIQ